MNKKQFKYISLLLASALLCIIAVQIIWVSTMVTNSKKELKRVFTEALGNASNELQRIEDLKLVGSSMNNLVGAKLQENHLNNISVTSVTNKNEEKNKVRDTVFTIIKIDSNTSGSGRKVIIKKVKNYGGGNFTDSTFTKVTIRESDDKLNGRVHNIDSMIKKLVLDFELRDISITTRTDTSQIKLALKKELLNKGLALDFEFAVYDDNNKELLASNNFAPGFDYAVAPLFIRDVYRKKSFLSAYPININSYVWSNLKTVLTLTIIFSLLILIIFIVTFRAILNQKKMGEIKNDFINNMTHELKTPIATISLAIDAINNPIVKNDGGKLDNYIQILKEENKKLNSHVERVLQVALLDKGELSLEKKSIELNTLINSSIATYKLQIQNKKATVTITGASNVFVNADEFHLSNVFNNLLDNALKYSNDNCNVNIDVEKLNDAVTIHFKDNGIGMDANVAKKVFDKFYRAEGGNLHGTKGFGLGLSYVKSIIEAHGGTIEVQSEKNTGSEFIIKLKI